MLSLIVPVAAHALVSFPGARLSLLHLAAARTEAIGTAPPGAATITMVTNWVKWLAGALAGVSVVVVGITMMVQHHSSTGVSHAGRVAKVFTGMLLVSGSTAIAAALVH